MAANPQNEQYISDTRQASSALLNAVATFARLINQDESAGMLASITEEDFTGSNSFLTHDEIYAVIVATKTWVDDNPTLATLYTVKA